MKKLSLIIIILLLISCEKEDNYVFKESNNKNISKSSNRNIGHQLKNGPDWVFHYVDNFDYANVFDKDYGINDNLNQRQLHGKWQGTTWVRRSGVWYDNKLIRPWFSQVNHPSAINKLSFHSDLSSLMLNYRIWPGTEGRYRISFETDPSIGNTNSPEWTSFMLDNSWDKKGYVSDMDFGFLIRSNGNIQVFQNGNLKSGVLIEGTHQVSDTYKVVLDITPSKLLVTINGTSIYKFTLNGTKIESAHPYLGAEIFPDSGHVSSFDNLVINTPKNNQGHILNYGYYWALGNNNIDPVYNHLDEIKSYTNFNFVAPNNFSELNNFPEKKHHALFYRWQIWPSAGTLNPNWETQWESDFNSYFLPNAGKISSLYVVDEPFWAVGVTVNDYNLVLKKIKNSLSANNLNIPISAVFAPDKQFCSNYYNLSSQIDKISSVIDNLDYIGINKYGANFQEIKQFYLDPLSLLIQEKNKKMILVPQTYFTNANCGFSSDESLAKLNWDYYNYALENDFVIAIKNYGLWTDTQPSDLPLTLQVQRLIGESITKY